MQFFDGRVVGKAAARPKRMAFKFNEPGKFEAEGNRLRMKSKLEQLQVRSRNPQVVVLTSLVKILSSIRISIFYLQADISTIARKTGITSATQLAKLVPKDAERGRVPDVEWWDAHIMANAEYPAEESANFELREGAVTKLIEHPIQMMPLEPRNQGRDSIRFIMLFLCYFSKTANLRDHVIFCWPTIFFYESSKMVDLN